MAELSKEEKLKRARRSEYIKKFTKNWNMLEEAKKGRMSKDELELRMKNIAKRAAKAGKKPSPYTGKKEYA